MNRKDTGVARNRGASRDAVGFVESFAKSFVRTDEFRAILHGALPEILAEWAGTNRIKKVLGAIIGRVLAKGFAPRSGFSGSPVVDTCSDPEFQRQAAAEIPGVVNAVIAAMGAFTRGLSEMPEEERRYFIKAFIETIDMGGIGVTVANLVKSLNMERHDPGFLIEALRPKIRSLLSELDFGEIKEMADASADGIPSLVGMVNEELWQYPSKMVCLLSLLPALGNVLIRSSVKTLEPINEMPPDLLTDVILSLVRDIDGKSIGLAVNQACELVRKIHTGSALIGDKSSHAVPAALSRLAAQTLEEIDVSLLLKSQGMLRDLRDLARVAVIEVLEDDPAIAADLFQSHFRSLVSWVRAWSRKAETFQRVFSDEDIAREFARGMGELDAQEMAAALSGICGLFNQVRRLSPGTIKSFLSQFFSALDERVLADTARWFIDDVVQAMKPIAPEIMPPVINGIAELIAPDGEISDEMKEACGRLGGIFKQREATA